MSENPPEVTNETPVSTMKNPHSGTLMKTTTTSISYQLTSLRAKRSWEGSPPSNDSFASDGKTPIKQLKRDDSLSFTYVASPREIRRLRADLIESRNLVRALEGRISHMHGVRKQMQLMFDEENAVLKRQQEYDKKSIQELESQLQSIRKREAQLTSDYLEISSKYDILKIKASADVEGLEKTIEELKETTRHLEMEESSNVSGLERKVAELESKLAAAEDEGEAQKQLVEELSKQLTNQNSLKQDLELKEQELQKVKLQLKDFKYAHENYLEIQQQAKSQAQKLLHYSELLKENEQLKEENIRLKDQVRNKLLLEEEVHDLKGRVVKYKELEKKYVDLQVQETQNSLQLNEWRAIARTVCESTESDTSLPHLLRAVVERLQQQELALTSEKVQMESELKNVSHENTMAKMELEKCRKLITELKSTGEQRKSLIHRIQKKLLLVTRERDSYRLQLDSYEKDLTINLNASNISSNQGNIQKERIASLEKIIQEYRDYITKLESDLQELQPGLQSDIVPARAEQVLRLQNEVSHLKAENERLRSRQDELEIQLESYAVGDDSLGGGQMRIHQNVNPLSDMLAQRESLVERLEQEVIRLKKKIKNLEDGVETSKIGDITVSSQELNALREEIKNHEAQTQMLKDFFKSQMKEFRNVIYMLFGYKIDRTQNSLYKLMSMYAEHESDVLCFQVNKEGDLTLLENEYTATLESLINLHLNHQKSIPVFLCALTIDLFNTKTMV